VLVVPGLGADAEAAHHAETAMGRSLLPPEVFEPVRGQFGVPNRVLNVPMAKVRLQRPRVMARIRQGEAASVPEHVRVGLELQLSLDPGALDHPREAGCGEWRAPLAYEYEGRRFALPLETAQRPHYKGGTPARSSAAPAAGGAGQAIEPDYQKHALGIDLILHQQGLDTTTPAGKAMFQMIGVFADFERAMIRERVKAGFERGRAQGKTLRLAISATIDAPSARR
jgi:hypothetical protein